MGNDGLIILFWVFAICGVIGIAAGIGNIFSEGAGWLTGGILCFIMIPIGIEFNNKFIK